MILSEARQLATDLMYEHGIPDWRFEFDKATRRFGCTHYGLKLITLSKALTLLNDEEQVKNTILHEIAHALAPRRSGHDRVWKDIAVSIGCTGDRLYDGSVVKTPPKPFKGTCPKCERVIERRRRDAIACGKCCKAYNNNRYSDEYLFKWERA